MIVRRAIAQTVAAAMLLQILMPGIAAALTSGPVQPEFASFESVSTASMVDPFTGQFSYSLPVVTVPGPYGSGYPLSLSYHSGSNSEDDASWVGKGWNLSPGSIVRNKRALPDDYKNVEITQVNRGQENWTVAVTQKVNAEVFSQDLGDNITAGALVTTRYNNNTGYHHYFDANLSAGGYAEVDYAVNDGEATFKPSVSPGRFLGKALSEATSALREGLLQETGISTDIRYLSFGRQPDFGILALSDVRYAVDFPEYDAYGFFGHVEHASNIAGLVGLKEGAWGSYLHQTSKDKVLQAFGYMYSGEATDNSQMDYYVEKESEYNSRDNYLGVPYSGADAYTVFGEGITGVFQAHQSKIGQYHPPLRQTSYQTAELGVELHTGDGAGLGAGARANFHQMSIEKWDGGDGADAFKFGKHGENDEPVFFRYFGDLAGTIGFTASDAPIRSTLPPNIPARNLLEDIAHTLPQGAFSPNMIGNGRAGRSVYVGYHTNKEMRQRSYVQCYGAEGPAYIRSYNKADDSRNFVDRAGADGNGDGIGDGIGEFQVVRPDGMRHTFGLPVYTRNEHELQFLMDGATSTDGLIAYKQASLDLPNQRVVGQIRKTPYASTYLLTEITTPDYIDRTNDGPSADDYGGYTKFNYVRTAGSDRKKGEMGTGNWYKWRSPYLGLNYNRNSFSDPNDDMGGVSYGEKEIYYLGSVETKTHIAFFRTSAREDGFEAQQNEADASSGATYTFPSSNTKLQKLDSICLYTKNADGSLGRLIQTTHFDYTYDLWPGTLNARQPNGAPGGKCLTLKRIYTETDGAINARVDPYTFGYTYKRSADYDAAIRALYPTITSYADDSVTVAAESPQYSSTNIDRWGYYRYNGLARSSIYNPWIDQARRSTSFDPAAGQLKWIQLPSGGEIHVQYEQNEYCYVQDRPAMAMVRLKQASGGSMLVDGRTTDVLLSLDDLGINPNALSAQEYADRVNALKTQLRNRFLGQNAERLYFKFLYALKGSQPNLVNCSSEYITGYLTVKDVVLANNGNDIKLVIGDANNNAVEHPQDLARRFYATQRAKIIDERGICDPAVHELRKREDDSDGKIFRTLLGIFNERFYDPATTATTLDLGNSYVRVPMATPKKGGGIRVKRLLTYDRGIESGAAALYGTEYGYVTADGICSGVATNEPAAGREENALIQYFKKRESQSEAAKMVGGADLELFEGPLGESLLPSPSVGYSRVVQHNIHTGLTGTGYAVSEYFTARNYPFNRGYKVGQGEKYPLPLATDIDGGEQFLEYHTPPEKLIIDRTFRTQGYSFILNSMHGRLRRVATYGGAPATAASARGEALSETIYEYYEPGEEVPLRASLYDSTATSGHPGREQEITMEQRYVKDATARGGVHGDFAISASVFLPLVGVQAGVGYEEHAIALQRITKVVRYPAILKSMRTIKDGVEQKVENIALNMETGAPVVIRTGDGFDGMAVGQSTATHDGSIYGYSIPAVWYYPAMGQIAGRERRIITDGSGVAIEKWYTTGHYLNFRFSNANAVASNVASTIGMLTPGDLVILSGESFPTDPSSDKYLGAFYVGAVAGNQVELLPTYISNVNSAAKTVVRRIEIVKTGRTNQLAAPAGSISTYGGPLTVFPDPLP